MSVKVSSWVWERSRTRGNDRLVLLAIADCCNDAGLEAYPSIDLLSTKTRLSRATIFRCLKRIAGIGELKIDGAGGRHSNYYGVQMDCLSLQDSHHPRRVARRGPGNAARRRQPSQIETVEPSQIETVEPSRYRDGTRRGTATAPVAVPRPDPSYTRHGTGTATANAPPDVHQAAAAAASTPPPAGPGDPGNRADVETFLAWWHLEYPAHNHGALNVPTWSTAGAVVAELLQHRTVAELQALALALWADRDDAWIFASDRSVFVLRHRADYLDRRQRDATPPAPAFTCEHSPSCPDYQTHTQKRRLEQETDK